jgi:chemotaxis protein methyltransferase CheR
MKDILPLSGYDFGLFQELLIEKSGLCFDEGRSQSLHLALWQRLQHRGYGSYREYYNLLKFHPEGHIEIRELLDLITIGETYFFRNKAQFDVLMKFVLPETIQRKVHSQDKGLRVWSAGCSGGDEAYSIAIAIMEVVPSYKDWNISILGTDINRNGLARAKEAIYGKKAIGHLPEEYLGKYFSAQRDTYILDPKVKALVQFEYHNLVKDPLIHEKMKNVDILFCRNVTIYFDEKTTKRVLENFYNCLAEDGYLFLGHSETLWQITNKFERVEFPQTFIYRKGAGLIQEEAMKPFMALPEIPLEELILPAVQPPPLESGEKKVPSRAMPHPWPETLASSAESLKPNGEPSLYRFESKPTGRGAEGLTSTPATGQPVFLQELRSGQQELLHPFGYTEKPLDIQKKVESAYQGAALCLKEVKEQTSFSSADHPAAQEEDPLCTDLAKATLLANEAKYIEAADILSKIIEVDNLSIDAYYLLGVISYKSNDFKQAEAQFRKVIYVDPDSVLAYFNLGNMYLYQRKYSEAFREFRNAIQLLERKPKDEQVRFCEDFTVEFLLKACRNSLKEITERGR